MAEHPVTIGQTTESIALASCQPALDEQGKGLAAAYTYN